MDITVKALSANIYATETDYVVVELIDVKLGDIIDAIGIDSINEYISKNNLKKVK